MDKKKLIIWSLYDFANSIVLAVFFLYYSQWLVVEKGVSDLLFNLTFAASSILLLLTAPVAAAIADKRKIRIPPLRITTTLSVAFFFLTGYIAAVHPAHYIWTMVTFIFATYFYLFSFSYYNPMLEDIASKGKQATASGWGQFGNWMGQIVGLLLALPLAQGVWSFTQGSARAETLMPAAILFGLFTLPLLLFFKEKQTKADVPVSVKEEYKNIVSSALKIFRLKYVGIFFLSYFFFNDAIITAANNFPIYIQNVFGVNDTSKSILLLSILCASAIGAPLSGWLSDKFGLKKALMGILAGWIVLFPVLALATDFKFFFAVAIVMGFWFGSIWTVTRAMLLEFVPKAYTNQAFTFYTLMERFATLVGPLSWGMIVAFGPLRDGLNYRFAAAAMAVFVLIGLLTARKLPADGGAQ